MNVSCSGGSSRRIVCVRTCRESGISAVYVCIQGLRTESGTRVPCFSRNDPDKRQSVSGISVVYVCFHGLRTESGPKLHVFHAAVRTNGIPSEKRSAVFFQYLPRCYDCLDLTGTSGDAGDSEVAVDSANAASAIPYTAHNLKSVVDNLVRRLRAVLLGD